MGCLGVGIWMSCNTAGPRAATVIQSSHRQRKSPPAPRCRGAFIRTAGLLKPTSGIGAHDRCHRGTHPWTCNRDSCRSESQGPWSSGQTQRHPRRPSQESPQSQQHLDSPGFRTKLQQVLEQSFNQSLQIDISYQAEVAQSPLSIQQHIVQQRFDYVRTLLQQDENVLQLQQLFNAQLLSDTIKVN